ncbi:MAG: SpoIIE family protein phosphatase [Capsulimonadaceae bacterium]|nr:SpoIIE family protein phosphatase [Capsulimonadaceae bacterium]
MSAQAYIELEHCQYRKANQHVAGDVFVSRRSNSGRRAICVLADGLGSGVEACTLASLTAQMALEFVASNIATRRAAEIVMDALPLCPRRKISYSTFTIVDTNLGGVTRIIEHGNPAFVLIRDGKPVSVEQVEVRQERWGGRSLAYSEFDAALGDRILIFSDGVSQAGMGTEQYPLSWEPENVRAYALECIRKIPEISASTLCELVAKQALKIDGAKAGDDITCAAIYIRKPRRLLVLSGPPYDKEGDAQYAQLAKSRDGKTVICGGTTANIVARELGLPVTMDLSIIDDEIPTTSEMPGVDLVTEGCLTLGKTAQMLEAGERGTRFNGATRLLAMLLQSDIIDFVVGTSINAAHQNPLLPVELDIRRNVIKKIARLLEDKHLKEVHIRYM